MKNVTTIPPDISFVDSLAEELWRRASGDVGKLADSLILLPTRRSCRALREVFLKHINKPAALLPRMQTLGDIDEEELYFAVDSAIGLALPPAITPLRRQLLLTQLISRKDKILHTDQAAQLAVALGQFLDQVQIENCDLTKLPDLVHEKDLAEHWQKTVAFLDILTDVWPKMLAAEGCLDPADRRNRVLKMQAEIWRQNPPAFPVIAGGSTGTMPATADFLDAIASMPMGTVILPGLDQQLNEEAWQAINYSHPQFGLKKLLEKFGVDRADVKLWGNQQSENPSRVQLLQITMLPAEVTDQWRALTSKEITADAVKGMTRIEVNHPQEEAQSIALIMRKVLDIPGKTAALVTPDRGLAERVCSMLSRWGIAVNDSGGSSLATQPIGAFLRDVLGAAPPHATSIEILSLLKHPYAACGVSPAECRALARQVEITVWRTDRPETSDWLSQFKRQLQPLTAFWHDKLPLFERLKAHIKLAEALATSDQEAGSERLWQGDAGEAAAEWLDDLRNASSGFPDVTGEEYVGLFDALMRAVTVRPAYGQHPRLTILGAIEARMIQADVIILGSLNEGVWPPEATVDPWMSRPMKHDFGLPSPERLIGLSAHDFVQLASAPEVVLTRAKRTGTAPTVPSRFLLQLETVLQAIGYIKNSQDVLAPAEPWLEWARMLDAETNPVPCDAPEPRPPVAVRPTQLSVTEIGTWRRNPYAIYAKHILKLKKLDPLEAEMDAADRGSMIHEALDVFVKKYPTTLPANALDELISVGRTVFVAFDQIPEVQAFWWPRFERIADWFVEHERQRRRSGVKLLQAEADGKIRLDNGFTLKGRADRIDQQPTGGLSIADYKTGGVPSQKEIQAGYEPQLALLALIAEQGGFKNLPAKPVSELAYWKLSGGRIVAEEKPVSGDIVGLIAETTAGLNALIESFAKATTPYQAIPKPQYQPRFDDYAHLARLSEWGRTSGDGRDE